MRDFSDQAWVTTAIVEDDVVKALSLCYSLKRVFTTRKLCIIISRTISVRSRQALDQAFDFVFYLDDERNTAHLELVNYAKVFAMLALSGFQSCVYASPSMLALRNSDDIFSQRTDSVTMLEDGENTSLFLFRPSAYHFGAIMSGLQTHPQNDGRFGSFMKQFARNNNKMNLWLDAKYCNVLQSGKPLLGLEPELYMVDFLDYPTEDNIDALKITGTLETLLAAHWLKIQRVDISPLFAAYRQIPPVSTPNSPHELKYVKEPIAIVGISCRFPGCNNVDELWNLLHRGEDATGAPPPFRWTREQCSQAAANGRKTNAGFLNTPVDEFDAKFFGLSPKETMLMDPQHRLLLEVLWESLEDACIDPHSLHGTSGSVFVGSWMNDYKDILKHSGDSEFYRDYMGNSIGAAAARISHLLEITGPSVSTESGCSSSMVAVHLACKSLRLRETNLALACGVNLLLHPFNNDEWSMIVSPDGHCKTFSDNANGFARAEGAGVLVLKRLSDAINDGDNVWGIIRGSSVRQEGLALSMGTPTVHCESLAMKEAILDADILPEEVSYVEAHGTGTVVGDPMEIAAIANAYHSENRKDPLIIGSVKTNVGHTESCSGITGIIKVLLSMHHETIPRHINFNKLNPSIDLNAVPAIIPLTCVEWKKSENPRIAGVNSFGLAGCDTHVIIEEPPQLPNPKVLSIRKCSERPFHILKLSAKSNEAMDILLQRYKSAMDASKDDIADIAFSANAGRANFNIRAVAIAQSKVEVCMEIEKGRLVRETVGGENPGKICFLFTGQGSQYKNMAKQLYESSPVFKVYFDYCINVLNEVHGINISKVLWTESSDDAPEINRTIYSQPSIFCVEYALFKLWQSWGITPDYVLGHSLGEFAAAVCAGLISVKDALTLVAARSRLIDELPGGTMLVVKASKHLVEHYMHRFGGQDENNVLDFAAINSNDQTVVSGDSNAVLEFSDYCANRKIKNVVLNSTHAFHSKHMDPILDKYREVARTVKIRSGPQAAYISGLKGDLISCDQLDSEYWVEHTRKEVNFLAASVKAVELGCNIFVEIGPHPVLSVLTMMNNDTDILCLPSMRKNENEWLTMLTSLGKLYLNGADVNWAGLDQFRARKKVHLPNYPFIKKKFWPNMIEKCEHAIHPLIGAAIPNASSTNIFQGRINLKTCDYMNDHKIGFRVIFPGAAYLEMCLAAGFASTQNSSNPLLTPRRPMMVENLIIKTPLCLEDTGNVSLQTLVEFVSQVDEQNTLHGCKINIFRREGADANKLWKPHAAASFTIMSAADHLLDSFHEKEFHKIIATPGDAQIVSDVYKKLSLVGLKFGPRFKSIERMWKCKTSDMLITKIIVPADDLRNEQYILHPVVLDAMIQSIMMPQLSTGLKSKLMVPVNISKFVWLSAISKDANPAIMYVQVDKTSPHQSCAFLLDSTGIAVAFMSGVELMQTTVKSIESILEQKNNVPDLWEVSWRTKNGTLQSPANLEFSPASLEDMNNTHRKHGLEKINTRADIREIFSQLDRMTYYYIVRCLRHIGWNPVVGQIIDGPSLYKDLEIKKEFSRQLGFFLTVLEEEGILERVRHDHWKVIQLPPTPQQIQNELENAFYNVDLVNKFRPTLLLAQVGEMLQNILQGSVSVLGILFPDAATTYNVSSAAELYSGYTDLVNVRQIVAVHMRSWFEKYQRELPSKERKGFRFRILEIGAGTGSYTKHFLELLEETGIEYEYTYTDVSTAFFPSAEKKFEKYHKCLIFKRLNIEEDPILQGFAPTSYDLVCASEVIHATKRLKATIRNVRTLLKQNGHFDLCEMTRVNRFLTFIFGLLNGFWRFEDLELRTNHCSISKEAWCELLGQNGFEVAGAFHYANGCNAYIKSKKVTWNSVESSINLCNIEDFKTWIVFTMEENPSLDFLVKKIPVLTSGRNVVTVTGGSKWANDYPHQFSVQPDCEQDFIDLMQTFSRAQYNIEGIIYGWPVSQIGQSKDDILRPCFLLVKSLLLLKQDALPRLYIMASGTVPLDNAELSNYYQYCLNGFIKSVDNENVGLSCKYIDIGPATSVEDMMQIFYELWNPENDVQVAFQGRDRYVTKLVPHKSSLENLDIPVGVDRFMLSLPDTNSISDLTFEPLTTHLLGPLEIEIQVKSAALNFLDVLSVIKPSSEFKNYNVVGSDFSGVVKRTGDGVSKWLVGDFVCGGILDKSALPSHIKLHEDDVIPVPKNMTFCEATTLPVAMSTSIYSLLDVAKITSSDTVLIHSASGGVGLCAIQICKYVGATIVATAGSKRKQNYLRSLGIKSVYNSRNTQYEQNIIDATNGRGVDVVLNSLTSKGFKEATINTCAKNARFVEMSKISIWTPEAVRKLRPDVKYTIIDLMALPKAEWRRLLNTIYTMIRENIISSIPLVRFDAVNIRKALQYIQQAKHIGKVVCVMPDIAHNSGKVEVRTNLFSHNATYLITGGLGGIGMEVCKWMLTLGAKFVILAGRNRPTTAVNDTVNNLNAEYGARVHIAQLDVSSLEQCRTLIEVTIKDIGYPELRGVMHAAGVLSDALIHNQTWESMFNPLNAKIKGTLNLHELTKSNDKLEHFVLFSSMAALFGPPGQSNHSAGCSFEDAFAHYRHSVGLPAVSVNWGQWGEAGVAAEVDLPGLKPFSTQHGLAGLEYALKSHRVQIGIIGIDSFTKLATFCPNIKSLVDDNEWKSHDAAKPIAVNLDREGFWKQLNAAKKTQMKVEIVKDKLRQILRNILKLDSGEIIEDVSNFQEMGVDSLMFVEIRNAIQALLGDKLVLSTSVVRDCSNVQILAQALCKLLEGEDVSFEIPNADQISKLIREDCVLPSHIGSQPQQKMPSVGEISNVLLTGATGTLGVHLLHQLSNYPQIRQIFCLLRSNKNESPTGRLENALKERDIFTKVNMAKVHCVTGNVASNQLGMDSVLWDELTNSIDAVFNCAASVQHTEHYRSQYAPNCARSVNVRGLKHILEFCCTGMKLKHVYNATSLVGVTTVDEDGKLSETWPQMKDYDGVTTFAYPITKFVGDVIMKEAITNRGIPGKAFRFSLMTGDSETGRFVLDRNHCMLRYLFSLRKGVIANSSFPVAVLPVDICAKISLELFFKHDAPSDVFNVTNCNVDADVDFVRIAQRMGYKVNVVDYAEYSKTLRDSMTQDSLMSIFEDFYTNDESVMSLYSTAPSLKRWVMDNECRRDFFVSNKLMQLIPEFYSRGHGRTSSMEFIYNDILFAKEQGWLDKFGL